MAGLRKAKQYDWKDSNLALFGSDTEKQVKKESAESEPAWKGAGTKVGLKVWRIVKFKVEHWPVEDYGKFYNGDSYIILNTYKEPEGDELLYDVHFWIGKYSTQDEYGTAAYKTVELDTLLDDKPVQHREVQNNESDLFKSYFPTITIMTGGADSGFRHVKPEEYQPRLLHFCGTRKNIEVKEVPLCRNRVKSGDVFILDKGLQIYQWNGSGSNKDERFKALAYLQALKSERGGKASVETLEEGEQDGEFFSALTGEDEPDDEEQTSDTVKKLFRLSDASGRMEFTMIREGSTSKSDLDSADVFILDTAKDLFVWVGINTSPAEKKNAMTYAHKYLQSSKSPLKSCTILKETAKRYPQTFEVAISA